MSRLSSSFIAVSPVSESPQQDTQPPFRRGIQYALAGDYPNAIELFSQALLIAPADADTYGNRCVVRHRSGDRTGAIADCRKAAELYKRQGNLARYRYALRALERLYTSQTDVSHYSPTIAHPQQKDIIPMRTKAMPVQPYLEKKKSTLLSVLAVSLLTCIMLLTGASSASAHHPFGGTAPSTLFEGFLSGVGHPLIGPDHFAFIVAVGLLAVVKKQGMLIPVAFVLSSLAGTGIHLASFNLPAPEFFISASVLLFGVFLAMKQQPAMGVISGLAAIAGLFHGYAYGEAIVGAQMTPLISYLAGFTLVQLGIAIAAFKVAQAVIKGAVNSNATDQPRMPLRFAGFTIGGIGMAFLSSVILG